MEAYSFCSPVGVLLICAENGAITELRLLPSAHLTAEVQAPCALLMEARRQLEAYFQGKRAAFDLPLAPRGTDFQKGVWDALRRIPYGETCSYGALAGRLGKPGAMRAVGQANNRNPIPILIPCHRVIGKNGDLVGYAYGLETKRFLLELEQKGKENARAAHLCAPGL